MKALLKSLQWVEIDESFLSENQYNTTEGKRIFDADIIKIKNDARRNKGRCRYCGKIVNRGEEEKHFTENEKKSCNGCFWYNDRQDGETITEKTKSINENGEEVTTTIEKRKYKKVCTYNSSSGYSTGCTNKECREYGISWFTPENTFFLAYPNGFTPDEKINANILKDFSPKWEGSMDYKIYPHKFGSYTLEAETSNGKLRYFTISNARNRVRFNIDFSKEKIVVLMYDSTFSYTVSNNFKSYHEELKCNDNLLKFFESYKEKKQ